MKFILTRGIVFLIALIILGITFLPYVTIKIIINDAEAEVSESMGNEHQNIYTCEPKASDLAYKLNGNATDPDGGPVASFKWGILTVPDGGSAKIEEDTSGSASPQASLFIKNGCGAQGTYIVKLAALDDDSQTGSDLVTININQPILNTTPNATINPVANLTTNQTLTVNSTSGSVTSSNATSPGSINGTGTLPGGIINGTDSSNGNVTEGLVESQTTNQTTLKNNNNNSSQIKTEDSLMAEITNETESSRTLQSSLDLTNGASTIEPRGNSNNDTKVNINTQNSWKGNRPWDERDESLILSISPIIASAEGSGLLASSYYSASNDIMTYKEGSLRTDNLGESPSDFELANLAPRYAEEISESPQDIVTVEESDKREETTSAIIATGNVNPANLEEDRPIEGISVEDNLMRSGEDKGSIKSALFAQSLAERIRQNIDNNDLSHEISSDSIEEESNNVKTDTNEKELDTVEEEKELKEIEDEEGEQKDDCRSDEIYDSDNKECKPCPSDEKPNDDQNECIKIRQEVEEEREKEKQQDQAKEADQESEPAEEEEPEEEEPEEEEPEEEEPEEEEPEEEEPEEEEPEEQQ